MSPTRIEALTPAQIARFAEFVERWTEIGLATGPIDRAKLRPAVDLLYRCGGLEPPERIVVCGSPMGNALTRAIIGERAVSVSDSDSDAVWDSVSASVRDSVGASVRDSVRGAVSGAVWEPVLDSVWDSVSASVRDSVGASVRDSVRGAVSGAVWEPVLDSVWDSVSALGQGASVGASVRDSVRDSIWGQHDAAFLAWASYFREVCGVTAAMERIGGLLAMAEFGWALPHEHICWVSERPSELHRDERGRLHSPSGMALRYQDGWGIYSWHGTRVPEPVILAPGSLSASDILTEPNAEVARVMLERVGIERFVAEADPTVLDAQPNVGGQAGKLLRVAMPHVGGGQMVVLHVRCPSTGHEYVLPVPPEMRTCAEALAWTAGVGELPAGIVHR